MSTEEHGRRVDRASTASASTDKVLRTLSALGEWIPRAELDAPSVSRWSVGMHIEHSLLGATGIFRAVAASTPDNARVKKSMLRRAVFLTGWIPRGRGKAPEAVVPREPPTEKRLRELLSEAEEWTRKVAQAEANCWWRHFVFGVFKRDDALRFVAIHNRHHLKIIADIGRVAS